MPVYHKFEEGDLLTAVVTANPRVTLVSGTSGWRGSAGGPSGSVSLYEGARARTDVRAGSASGLSVYPHDPVDTHSVDRTIFVSGSYPATGSARFPRVRSTVAVGGGPTDADWYDEHFSPILNLFEYYARESAAYTTASYDHYCLFFWQSVAQTASHVAFTSCTLPALSAQMSVEARAKALVVSSTSQDFTIAGQRRRWKFYVTGSTGQLAWTDYASVITSTLALPLGTWQHVAFILSGSTGTFYVGGSSAGGGPMTGTLAAPTSSGYVTVGAELSASGPTVYSVNGFKGFLHDLRVWSAGRTASQVSGSSGSVLATPAVQPRLALYARFNDGPLASAHGYTSGSGAFDYSSSGSHGQLTSFNAALPLSPTWQPVDDPWFIARPSLVRASPTQFRVLHLPSMYYGRQIATGSVRLTCEAYRAKGIERVLVDDGAGALYVSGSVARPLTGQQYRGSSWNKVGNVFYAEGLAVITDPSLLDFGDAGLDSTSSFADLFQAEFRGTQRLTTRVFQCRVGAADANASNNKTYSETSLDPQSPYYGLRFVRRTPPVTWISAVGLYSSERKLVAVAKLASPIRKREKDKLLIRLRHDI